MSAQEIDAYLADVPEPQRTTLEALRSTLRSLLPEAEEGLAYGVPAFKVDGTGVAGFAAYQRHCSYFPMSGGILPALAEDLAGYTTSKGALKFPVDRPLPKTLVRRLVKARLAEIARAGK
ncbi:MAG: DUF1801 domain-containing protein [Actinomycetes bacterium]